MKKKILFSLWLVVPVVMLAIHYGPGQPALARQVVMQDVIRAQTLEKNEDWRGAVEAYAAALAGLPEKDVARSNSIRLARAKARMHTGELPEAMVDMDALLEEMTESGADPVLAREVRANLASAQYYAGWLMRLEGGTKDEWTPAVDNARQHFRHLAESTSGGDRERYQKNLEASIRLMRMNLSELEGLPLPKSCQGCKNVCQKCRGQSKSKLAKKGKKEGEKKEKDARGAGFSEMPKGGS